MQVDFFDNPHKAMTDSPRFGLCDDVAAENCPKNPAYLDESSPMKWTAVVTNRERKHATFYPIDNCIKILRPNGEMDNRCDGMLNYDSNLLFVELKDRISTHGWIKDCLNQLKVTIQNFKKYHDTEAYGSIKAQLCNKQRPAAVVACNNEISNFKDETGYIVRVDRNITI